MMLARLRYAGRLSPGIGRGKLNRFIHVSRFVTPVAQLVPESPQGTHAAVGDVAHAHPLWVAHSPAPKREQSASKSVMATALGLTGVPVTPPLVHDVPAASLYVAVLHPEKWTL